MRQGRVLSGTEFASFIDDIEVELQKENLGVKFIDIMVASLILMDDITLIASSPSMLQRMLDILTAFGRKWHLKFSIVKTRIMIVGTMPSTMVWKLSGNVIQITDQYVCLGEVITNDLNLDSHIYRMKQKAFSIYETITAVAQIEILANIQLTTLLQLYRRCLLPAVLYNAATWIPSKDHYNQMEKLQITLLRKIIKAPTSAPIIALYIELGIWPLEYQIDKIQLMYLWKVANSKTIATNILNNNKEIDGLWNKHITKRVNTKHYRY